MSQVVATTICISALSAIVLASWQAVAIAGISACLLCVIIAMPRKDREDLGPLRTELRELEDRIAVIEAREAFK